MSTTEDEALILGQTLVPEYPPLIEARTEVVSVTPLSGDLIPEVAPLAATAEPVIHGIVGAQFGDLEYDVGKSVRWLEFFVDDLFIMDINTGEQRYWVINWAESFPDSKHSVTGRNFFYSKAEATEWRKEQFAAGDLAFDYEDEDWVLFIDGHEGLSFDNRSLPDDYDAAPFMSWMYREIARAVERGQTAVHLPFFVYLKYSDLQNITYATDADTGGADVGIPPVSQGVSVPWYLPAGWMPRLFQVSSLRNPAFDWSTIDTPVSTPPAGEVSYLDTTMGTFSAADAADLNITTDVRFTAKIRDDSTESATTRMVVAKSNTGSSVMSWRFGHTNTTSFNSTGYPLGTPSPQTVVNTVSRASIGLTPPGTDRYVGSIQTGVSPSAALALRGQMITSTDGVTWTNSGALGTAVAANTMSNDSASPLLIGQVWQGRIYWAQMERVNQRQFIFPGPAANYLTTSGTPFDVLNGKITFIFQVAPADWTKDYQCLISRRASDPNNSFDLLLVGQASRKPRLSLYIYNDGTIANRYNVNSAEFPVAGVDGQPMWMACTYEHDNGAAGRTARFFSSPDGVTWTIVGTAQILAGVFPAKVGTATPVQVGTIGSGTFTFNGRFMRAIVNNGVGAAGVPGGDRVFELVENDATNWTTGTFPATSQRYVAFPGTASNSLSTPDAAALDITTADMTITARVALTDWTPAGQNTLVSKWTGTNCSYLFRVLGGGYLSFVWSNNGTAFTQLQSTAPVPAVDGAWKWVGVTFDRDNAATGNDVRFWTSDDAITWTQLGTTQTTAGVATIFAGTAPLYLGTQSDGVTEPLLGKISNVSIRNNIGAAGAIGTAGTEVFRFDANTDLRTTLPAATSFLAYTGQTVTVNRAGGLQTELATMAVTPTGTVVQTVPDEVIWRWDGQEVPANPAVSTGAYISIPGTTTGNFISTPDPAALAGATQLDIRWLEKAPANGVAGYTGTVVTAQATASNSNFAFWLTGVNASANVNFTPSSSGTAGTNTVRAVRPTTGVAACRYTWRSSDGRVQAFTKATTTVDGMLDNTGWVQSGANSTAAVAALFNSTANLSIGKYTGGAASTDFTGLMAMSFATTIDGTPFAMWRADQLKSRYIDAYGADWTVNGTANIWYKADGTRADQYTDPRGRQWTMTAPDALHYEPPALDTKAQIVSYGYAHWNIQDIPPGETTVPALSATNDDGWKMRNLLSRIRPIAGIPYGDTWQDPSTDPNLVPRTVVR